MDCIHLPRTQLILLYFTPDPISSTLYNFPLLKEHQRDPYLFNIVVEKCQGSGINSENETTAHDYLCQSPNGIWENT